MKELELYVPDHEVLVRLVGWGADYVLLETSGCPECQHTGCLPWEKNHNLARLMKKQGIKVVVVANDGSCGDNSRFNRLVIRDVHIAQEVFTKPAPKNFDEVWSRFLSASMTEVKNRGQSAIEGGRMTPPEVADFVARAEDAYKKMIEEINQ